MKHQWHAHKNSQFSRNFCDKSNYRDKWKYYIRLFTLTYSKIQHTHRMVQNVPNISHGRAMTCLKTDVMSSIQIH